VIAGKARLEVKQYETLAYCGLFCGGCKNYKSNLDCAGCRYEESLVADCPTRACAEERGLLHCGDCDQFPCDDLKGFYEDGIRHHAMALKNIERIREIGPDRWLSEQEEAHTCECGRRKLWFAEGCTHETDSG
jgi:hypothetical protein